MYAARLMTGLVVDAAQLKFVELPGYRMAYREWGDTMPTDAAVGLASANPRVRIVTVANADHNIHRGQFDASMAEVESLLKE
jgi:hypothetical protein